ncbi:MAG: prephenate dehydratase [Granulosicoccus sp.]|jgi:prephenate dehydratase
MSNYKNLKSEEEKIVAISEVSAELIKQPRIAIQGVPGAFHHIAARRFFNDKNLEIIPADTFEELMVKAEDKLQTDRALMAIENTIAGSILNNYQLLNHSNLHIVGEVYLRIQQNLMVFPGVKIEDLTEVYSHPVAIAQCHKFFQQYPHVKLIESEDTALSAKRVRDGQLKNTGAIASSLAAEMYDLEMIGKSIETYKKNYTRFLVLDRAENPMNNEFDKVSLCFTLPHEVGSLHQVLAALALCKTNLTKIQSAPLLDSEFEYLFFVDFLLDENKDFESIINVIKKHTLELRILGTYNKGKKHEH